MRRSTAIALLGLLAGSPSAQGPCSDPATPTAGFPVTEQLNASLTYADGYVVLADMRFPSVAPGPCGWPLLVLVHAGGQEKSAMSARARLFAAAGYAVIAFDVRGNGVSFTLNDPTMYFASLVEFRRIFDLFEIMEFAEAAWPNEVDFTRIGVTGSSQGGRNSWWGAAFSGTLPPPNPWRTAPFPTVTAVSPVYHTADQRDLWVPEGRAVSTYLWQLVMRATKLSPAELVALQSPLLAEDYPGFAAALAPAPIDLPPLLASSNVPWACTISYDDTIVRARDGLNGTWAGTPPGIAKRTSFSTGSHFSPRNTREVALRFDLRKRWLDRWLKGAPNGVDTEPPVRFAITPDDAANYVDASYLWDERTGADVPPTGARQRWFLEAGAALSTQSPTATSASDLVDHQSSIDVATYSSLLPSAATLMASFIPLSSQPYDTPPLTADVLLLGAADVKLFATSAQTKYQLHAALYDVDPLGNERYVSSGFRTVRDDLPAGTNALDLSSYVQGYVFRAGHRVRLRVENLVLHAPPNGRPAKVLIVPVFESSRVLLHREAAQASYVDLPLVSIDAPSLVASQASLSDSAPVDVTYALHTTTGDAGAIYVVLLGLSGTSPGVDVAGVHYPLNPDALTSLALGAPSGFPFAGLVGTTDASGYVTAGLSLSTLAPLGLSGATLSAIAVALDPATGLATSSIARDLPIGP